MGRHRTQLRYLFIAAAVLLCTPLLLQAAVVSKPSPHTLRLTLRKVIELAAQNNPLRISSRLDIENAHLFVDGIRVRYAFPRIDLESYAGLVNDARGDATYSPDEVNDYSHMGPFYKVDIRAVQPLFTFGKFTAAMNASRHRVQVKEEMDRRVKDRLACDVAKAYWAVLASREAVALGEKVESLYEQLLKKAREYLARGESGVDDSHLLEIKALHFGIQSAYFASINRRDMSMVFLRHLINLDPETTISIGNRKIPSPAINTQQLSNLLERAMKIHPDLKAVNAGLQALDQKATLAYRKAFPDLFVAAGGGIGRAPGRDRQTNPFIVDTYNYDKIGAVLGVKWDLNFFDKRVEYQKARIEYQKLLQKKRLAGMRIDADIRECFARAQKYHRLISAARSSLKAAKSWVRLENDNFQLAIGDAKRLVDAYKAYYQLAGEQIENRYNYVAALAELARAAGDMSLYLDWIERGVVTVP